MRTRSSRSRPRAARVPPSPALDAPAERVQLGAERAYPGRIGRPGVATYQTRNGPQEVHYLEYDGQRIADGDILLPPEGRVSAQSAGVIAQTRWPNGVIPFEIDPSLPSPSRVTAAIQHWQDYTRIRFVPHTTETDFVAIVPGDGCFANIGHVGGRQTVHLAENCDKGSVIHELGHTVGLFHEQSRVDRDNYVNIYWANIDPNQQSNYQTYIQQWNGFDIADDIGPYDFGSIMHYGSCAFSIYPQCEPTVSSGRTMLKKDGSGIVANRTALSVLDMQAVAAMYGGKVLPAPTGLHGGAVASGEIWLDWNDNPEPSLGGYIVYRNGVAIARLARSQGSSFADRGLPADADFTYQVSAYALDNTEGGALRGALHLHSAGRHGRVAPVALLEPQQRRPLLQQRRQRPLLHGDPERQRLCLLRLQLLRGRRGLRLPLSFRACAHARRGRPGTEEAKGLTLQRAGSGGPSCFTSRA